MALLKLPNAETVSVRHGPRAQLFIYLLTHAYFVPLTVSQEEGLSLHFVPAPQYKSLSLGLIADYLNVLDVEH